MNLSFKDAAKITLEDLTQEDPRDQSYDLTDDDNIMNCEGKKIIISIAVYDSDET